MATMENVVVEDFSDLGQSFYFSYLGKNYVVPPIPPSRAKKLITISTELGKRAKFNDVEATDEMNMEEIDKNAADMFNTQVKFISESGIQFIEKDGTNRNVSMGEIEDEWSTQLVVKVFERVNGVIFGTDKKIEEKKL